MKKKQLSEISQMLAKYLIENGTNPLTDDGSQKYSLPNHYKVTKKLPDGRNLSVYFCDINKPRRSSVVDKRRVATPAVRVGVFVFFFGKKKAAMRQIFYNLHIR